MTAPTVSLARVLPVTRPPRLVPALSCAAALDLAVGVTLARVGQEFSVTSLTAYVVITGLGLVLGMSRPVPGGVRLRDLNRAAPCANMLTAVGDPAAGFACRNYGFPPAGQWLVPAQLPSGNVIQVCPPCAAVIGGMVDVQVTGEIVTDQIEAAPVAELEAGQVTA